MFWILSVVFFFFKQKTAYELRISDWSSDVCSSDLQNISTSLTSCWVIMSSRQIRMRRRGSWLPQCSILLCRCALESPKSCNRRSEEHTSELQSLMRNSYAVFCLKKKKLNKYKQLHIYLHLQESQHTTRREQQ